MQRNGNRKKDPRRSREEIEDNGNAAGLISPPLPPAPGEEVGEGETGNA